MAKFLIDVELSENRDAKSNDPKVRFDYRYDGHYAMFTVNANTRLGAIDRLIRATDDLANETSFCVDNNFLYRIDEDGTVVADEDF